MADKVKYSDVLVDQLVELGYTHAFFLGGGNVMHLIESARTRMVCVPVVHEVSAGIGAEYFNVAMRDTNARAVVFVTAGPGLSNLITAISGAWLESRELLVIGGQARTEFLSRGTVRQIGHQEIDGVSITSSITKKAVTIEKPMSFDELKGYSDLTKSGRKGPVFIELCLDVSATFVEPEAATVRAAELATVSAPSVIKAEDAEAIASLYEQSTRPLMLVGHGLPFGAFTEQKAALDTLGLPVATSWNAADYLDYNDPIYAGRPNTYGMRWANAVVQQCDLLLVVGARLGLQQTGFNWQEFAPLAKIVHIDIDPLELAKNNPGADLRIEADAADVFGQLVATLSGVSEKSNREWLSFIAEVKETLTTNEAANQIFDDYVNPFDFVTSLSDVLAGTDSALIPCSSGGSYTTVMQAYRQKVGDLVTNDKALASMGYGLAGAVGTAVALPHKNVVLLEGDGGFAQNYNEIGTVANRNLNLKMVVFDNGGYASIRLSQKAYFDGNYVGCDAETGVGLPDWSQVFDAYGIPSVTLSGPLSESPEAQALLKSKGPGALILKVSKEQPFYPKVTSRIFSDGTMKSNPIHLMFPPLDNELADRVFKYLPEELKYPQ
jgi:acetolactate synthase I/II/III large subunit